ncbi:hypothetical protein [Pseudomonas sp. OV226]|uniref:hypothetical protein n=1 Tax=Pseudomonas sp. OV226 TaxID=2135588 RepID=UPI000D6B009E|nr:hypothetical protein [Pseudomonas sp. OV226]PWK29729.1 hypothetical protein C7534_13422 [Pseudomonas sp. OV226]
MKILYRDSNGSTFAGGEMAEPQRLCVSFGLLVKYWVTTIKLFLRASVVVVPFGFGMFNACASTTLSASELVPSSPGQVTYSPSDESAAILKLAVLNDATDHHEKARVLYDLLRSDEFNQNASVSSAVNLAVLGRYDEAKTAFTTIVSKGDVRAATYAQFWQLWLTAKTFKGSVTALQKELEEKVSHLKPQTAYQQKLVDVYAGIGSVDSVFAEIAKLTFDERSRRDARVEMAFFAGGYLEFVHKDLIGAKQLYVRELPWSSESIERPLLEQAINAL